MAKNKQADLPPEGWYPDDSGTMRWWDGAQWTPWRDGTGSSGAARTPPPDRADLSNEGSGRGQTILFVVVAALGGLIAGLFIGLALRDGDSGASEKQAGELTSLRADLEAAEADLEEASRRADEATSRVETLEKREKQVGILDGRVLQGDGTFVVGQDLEPGTYRSIANNGCTWQRSNTEKGGPDARILAGTINGADVVTVLGSDASFTTKKCNLWFRID